MKKVIVFIVLGVFVGMVCFSSVGCSGKKPEPVDSDSISAISDTTAADTLDQIIAETPMPSAADELFDDFFFNFAANRKLQMKRIVFPLPVIAGKDTTFLPKKRWKMDHFFMHQDFYTLIFDNMKQMNVVKDTTINRGGAYQSAAPLCQGICLQSYPWRMEDDVHCQDESEGQQERLFPFFLP